ncbi:MAG TPA: hypothetical protein VEB41_15820, partial [Burkholderiales bacterium]|nr:hypothetical protein [Burkholderiales bacterium]
MGGSPYAERRVGERRRVTNNLVARTGGLDGLRVSWGGVWGGVLVSLGSLILLSALGVAVGVTAVDPNTADAQRVAAIAGIWGAASLLASLFLGGMVSTRTGMVYDRATGMFEGVLVWVVSVLLMAAFAGSGMSFVPEFTFDPTASRAAAWIGLGALVLSLLSAVWGAMAGRRGAAERA